VRQYHADVAPEALLRSLREMKAETGQAKVYLTRIAKRSVVPVK
jgi:hypothetical protein